MSSRHESDSSSGNCEHHLSEAQGNNKDDSSAYASLGIVLFCFHFLYLKNIMLQLKNNGKINQRLEFLEEFFELLL